MDIFSVLFCFVSFQKKKLITQWWYSVHTRNWVGKLSGGKGKKTIITFPSSSSMKIFHFMLDIILEMNKQKQNTHAHTPGPLINTRKKIGKRKEKILTKMTI